MDISTQIGTCHARAQADARVEATREDGSVDDYAEALAFRRLLVEAARQYPED